MFELRLLLKTLLLPPAFQLLLVLVAWRLWHHRRWVARGCLVAAIVSLWLFSTPLFASWLSRSIEPPPLPEAALDSVEADAIVILSATLRSRSPEFENLVSSRHGIERLRYGAFLHRHTGLPIAISGCHTNPLFKGSLAQYMGDEMRTVFDIEVKWLETGSRITAENASFSRALLAPAGVNRILLVTHAAHMRRAAYLFTRAGFDVIPAPTAFTGGPARLPRDLLPTADALAQSSEALHEILGYAYYRVAGLLDG